MRECHTFKPEKMRECGLVTRQNVIKRLRNPPWTNSPPNTATTSPPRLSSTPKTFNSPTESPTCRCTWPRCCDPRLCARPQYGLPTVGCRLSGLGGRVSSRAATNERQRRSDRRCRHLWLKLVKNSNFSQIYVYPCLFFSNLAYFQPTLTKKEKVTHDWQG